MTITELKNEVLKLRDMIGSGKIEIKSKCLVCGRITYGDNYLWTHGYHLCSKYCQELYYRLNGPNSPEFVKLSHDFDKFRDKIRLYEQQRISKIQEDLYKSGNYETSELAKHYEIIQ